MAGRKPPRWERDERLQLLGWGMFVVCAVLFTLSSLRNRDPLATAASLIFLAACFVFLFPFFKR